MGVFTADAQAQHLPYKIEKTVNVIASRLRLSRGKLKSKDDSSGASGTITATDQKKNTEGCEIFCICGSQLCCSLRGIQKCESVFKAPRCYEDLWVLKKRKIHIISRVIF